MTGDRSPVASLLDFTGRVVLVTGAAGGLGAGIADRFAEAGARVVRHRRADGGSSLAAGGSWVAADLTDPAAIESMIDLVAERCGVPTVVVNNAGIQPVVPLAELTAADFDELMASNARSALLVSQAVVTRWAARRDTDDSQGSGEHAMIIVNIASIEGLTPAVGHAHYSASKAALVMLTQSCALEWAELGVRVNAIAPGLIDRPGLADDWPDGVARWQAGAPLRRLGTPTDIADACLFLASPAAAWITGTTLRVDGGIGVRPAF